LLNIYGSVKNVEKAERRELQESVGDKTGGKVFDYFEKNGETERN
jgi:hypothetical protein